MSGDKASTTFTNRIESAQVQSKDQHQQMSASRTRKDLGSGILGPDPKTNWLSIDFSGLGITYLELNLMGKQSPHHKHTDHFVGHLSKEAD